MAFTLDYAQVIPLDAEDLAEMGILAAYESLLPELQKHVPRPAHVEEIIDEDAPSYTVRCGAREYPVIVGDEDDASWPRAAFALFDIVNAQLARADYRLYAIGGGNELGGVFLTEAQALAARAGLPDRGEWPYLPTSEPPSYGMHG